VSSVLGATELDTGLQVGSHQSRAEGQNHLPRPTGHAAFDAVQDTVGFLGCECILPGRVELTESQREEVLPHVQTGLPMLQFVPIAPCPVAGHQ